MITCPACGKENEDSAFECKRCRAPLREDMPEEHHAEAGHPPAHHAEPAHHAPPQHAAPEPEPEPEPEFQPRGRYADEPEPEAAPAAEPEASSDALGMVCRRCEAYNEPGIRVCTACGYQLFADALAAAAPAGEPPLDKTPPQAYAPPHHEEDEVTHDATPPEGNASLSDELSALALSDQEAAEAGMSTSGNGAELDKTPPQPYPAHEPEPVHQPSRGKVAEVAAAAATAAGVVVGAAVGVASRRSPAAEPPPSAPPQKAPEPAAAPAEKLCASCGAGNPPAAKFCFDCGTPFAKKAPPPEPKAEPPPRAPEPIKAAPPPPMRIEPIKAAPPPPMRIEPIKAAPPPPKPPEPVKPAPPPPMRIEPIKAAPPPKIEPARMKAEPPPSIVIEPSIQVDPDLTDSTAESAPVEASAPEEWAEAPAEEPLPEEPLPEEPLPEEPLPEELPVEASGEPLAEEPLPEEATPAGEPLLEEPLAEEAAPAGEPLPEDAAEPLPEEALEAATPAEEAPPPFQATLVVEKGASAGTAFMLAHLENSIGGSGAHVELAEDPFVAPHAATLLFAEDHLVVRDEGSANGVFVKVRESAPIEAGDLFVAGERLFRYDGPAELARDGEGETPFLGAPRPQAAAVRVTEVLAGGKTGRTCHRSGPVIAIGRTGCDMNFPADGVLAARHAEVRLGDDGSATLVDLGQGGSGVFVRVRAQAQHDLQAGDILLVGDQHLRVEVS